MINTTVRDSRKELSTNGASSQAERIPLNNDALEGLQHRVKRLEKMVLVLLSKIKHVDGEDVTAIMNCIESMEGEDVTLQP